MTTTKQSVIDRIKEEIPCTWYLTKARKSGYICPLCGSGEGEHGTGALEYYEETNTWYCHKCETGGDVIKLIQSVRDCDFKKAVKELSEELDEEPPAKVKKEAPQQQETPPLDFMHYYTECEDRFRGDEGKAARDYIESRGIDLNLADEFGIGFDPQADPAGTGIPNPRIIIPVSESFYVARSINPLTPDAYKALNPKGASVDFFNFDILEEDRQCAVFIVEGVFDALSVIEAGEEEAVAINSTGQAGKFLEALETVPRNKHLIICMDNDAAGEKARDVLAAGLSEMGFTYSIANISGDAKDPNEALQKDRDALGLAIYDAMRDTRPDSTSRYIDRFMQKDVEKNKREILTGFPIFDQKTGGLSAGLYVFGAISSLGKTSFCLQLADQLAERGEDVLFFSLEMSRLELVTKSLARTAAKLNPKQRINALQIRRGAADVRKAIQKYKDTVGDRLSIIECDYDMSISAITEYIRQYMRRTGARPIIFIDYLQIIPMGGDGKRGRREAIDNSVVGLRRFAREINSPVIVISSLNRTNYSTPIAFESFKESGGIEYSADCLLGMQLQIVGAGADFQTDGKVAEKRKAIDEAKQANPRKIEIKCLKNRSFLPTFSLFFDYEPDIDTFTETGDPREAKKKTGKTRADAPIV
jgi:replicative DNA helicase